MLKKYLFAFLFLLLPCLPLFAQLIVDEQDSKPLPEGVNLNSPYHTTLSFFINLEPGNFKPSRAARTLDRRGVSGDPEDLAVKLQQIFEGKGVIIRTSEIPNEPNYVDSTANLEHKYYFDKSRLPGIYLEKRGSLWRFSSFSVSQINQLHAETYPFGTDQLLNLLPKIGTDQYFGLQLWQIFGMMILILLTFLSHLVFTFLVDKVLLYLIKRLGYGYIGENYLLPIAKITSFYLIVLLLSLLIRVLQLPVEIWAWIVLVFNTLKPFLITIIFYKIVDVVAAYFASLAAKTASTLDDQLVPLLRKTLKALVIIVGTLFILKDGLDLDIIPFLTGLSIGGVAIALAAQDTIKNFFGSIMIFIDKPFQVGDWVTSGEIDGTVEEVGFRSTRIRTFRNSLMYVPNGKIADAVVDNHGLRQYRRFTTTLTLTYFTPPALIEQFVVGLREIVKNHPKTRKDLYHIYFNNLSTYSQDVMFYIFFEVPTIQEELHARHEILIQIVKLAQALGVRFAFPTQTLHMETFPEKKGIVQEQMDRGGYENLLKEFLRNDLGQKLD
ncbi:mechanosensitive ion channel family protein [Algoriphagus sp. AK58]|uniref:mechanosensitive ion channel family protein n=1 Tax=Algoriphagus sp. AK58 TaxID=1406877 RepID=UPI0016503AE4|nr:mechanosensitive ion channel family protein [Algoriphagus sp. AK58]MBC6367078.1 mechanosensitive ion channel protein [Algoriphagus sp. AK58]